MAEPKSHERMESKMMDSKEHKSGMAKATEPKRKKGRKMGRGMKRGR